MIIHNSHKGSTEKLTSDGLDGCIFRQKHKAELWCPQPAPVSYIFAYSAWQHVTCDTYCINQFRYGMKLCMHAILSAREETNPVSAVRLYHPNPETASLTTRVRHNLGCDARQWNKNEHWPLILPCSGTTQSMVLCGWLVHMLSAAQVTRYNVDNCTEKWNVQRDACFSSLQPPISPSTRLSVCLYPFIHPSIIYLPTCLSVRPSVRPSIHPSVRPSIRPSVHPSVRPSIRPSVRPSIRPSVRPSVRLPVCLSLSVYPVFLTAIAVFSKPNATPLCFSTDLVLNFLLSWLLLLLPFYYFKIYLTLTSHPCLELASALFSSRFPTGITCAFIFYLIHAICPSHRSDCITHTLSGEQYKFQSSP